MFKMHVGRDAQGSTAQIESSHEKKVNMTTIKYKSPK